MIQAVIVDDEPNNINTLQQLLERFCPQVEVTGTARNIQTARQVIEEAKPDLVFLDIEMPYGNAFDLLNSLPSITFEIVFVTAFDNYAIHAIKYSALDYLLKPVNIKELQEAVQKASIRLEEQDMQKKISNLLFNLQTPKNYLKRLAIPVQEGMVFIHTDECVRLEASTNYTIIHLSNKNKLITSRSLGDFEELLDSNQFTRIHRSHIINHRYVKKYHRGRGGFIEMEDGTNIEVAIRKKDEFLNKFG